MCKQQTTLFNLIKGNEKEFLKKLESLNEVDINILIENLQTIENASEIKNGD